MPAPDECAHPPVNFHGYAACTRGVFQRDAKRAIAAGRPVLLLLRGDFKATQRALVALKKHGLTVAVSLKETGLHQIARQLSDPKRAARFRAIVQAADGCLAATPEALAFYGRGDFIPTPYPIDDPRWDFSRSLGERCGIFVGTREWNVPSRHHLAALVMAGSLGEPVTVFDEEPQALSQDTGRPRRPARLAADSRKASSLPRLPRRDGAAQDRSAGRQKRGSRAGGGRCAALPPALRRRRRRDRSPRFSGDLRPWSFVRRIARAGEPVAARSRLLFRDRRCLSGGSSGTSRLRRIAEQLAHSSRVSQPFA